MIGRDDTCPIRLDENVVSRHHAAVVREGEEWAVHDLESENGIYVNGVRENTRALVDGDRIQVGSYMLLFRAESGGVSASHIGASPTQSYETLPGSDVLAADGAGEELPTAQDAITDLTASDISGLDPNSSESTQNLRPRELLSLRKTVEASHGPRLVVTTDRREVTFPLERKETTLGKAKDCHVPLPELGWGGGRVARVVMTGEGEKVELFRESRLCDVRVNEKKIRSVVLTHGDTVTIGVYKIVYLSGL